MPKPLTEMENAQLEAIDWAVEDLPDWEKYLARLAEVIGNHPMLVLRAMWQLMSDPEVRVLRIAVSRHVKAYKTLWVVVAPAFAKVGLIAGDEDIERVPGDPDQEFALWCANEVLKRGG